MKILHTHYLTILVFLLSTFYCVAQNNPKQSNSKEENNIFAFSKDENSGGGELVKLPLLRKPELQENGQMLFRWQRKDKGAVPLDLTLKVFKSEEKKSIEHTIAQTRPVLQKKVKGNEFLWVNAAKILQPNQEYFYILVSDTPDKNKLFENNGRSTPIYFSNNHPDCLPPYNSSITNSTSNTIDLSWSGTGASRTGVRYLIQVEHINPTGKIESVEEYWAFNGNSFSLQEVGEAGTYRIQLRRICDGEDTHFELASDWVHVGNVTYNGESQTENSCSSLNSFSVALINGAYVTVQWDGPEAQIDGIRYILHYRKENATDWKTQFVFSGNEYTFLLEDNTNYEFGIVMIEGGEGFNYTTECPMIEGGVVTTGFMYCEDPGPNCYTPPTEEEPTEPEITLPEFNCGEPFTPTTVTAGTPLESAQIGDIFFIGDFPILLKEVVGANGIFSGEGIIPLPFGEKVVWVEFNDVSVNEQYQIFQGTVNGVSSGLTSLPNLNSVINSGEICLEVPNNQPYDSNGFNSNGEYAIQPPYPGWSPTDSVNLTYDPNGFNSSGIHVVTGTEYNESGCNQEGLDEQGQPCTFSNGPYYWLNDTPTTPEGVAFAGQVGDSLRIHIESLLGEIHSGITDSISAQAAQCQTIRTDMEGLLQTLGHQRVRVFGGDDKYFNEGMSQYFISEPEPILGIYGRDAYQIDFENKHIDLYHCDVLHISFKRLDTILVDAQISSNIDITEADILNLIKGLSAQDVALFQSDPVAFLIWLKDRLIAIVNNKYEQLYSVVDFEDKETQWASINKTNPDFFHNPNEKINPSTFLASNDPNATLLSMSNELTAEDKLFQYRQGWQYIGDVHRAYYLDAILKERDFYMSTNDPAPNSLLPLGFTKTIASREHTIILDNIVFTPTGATLDAYMLLEVPTTGDKLAFTGLGISFGPTGMQTSSTLNLETDVEIRLNNAARLTLKGTEETFVSWDCGGFSGMGIDAEIEFCRKYLLPLDEPSLDVLPDPQMVKGYFQTTMPTWGEVIVDIDMDAFAISKYEEIKWQIHDAKLDFSDTQNPNGIIFPEGYESPFITNGVVSPLWKGFYLGQLSVTLPKSLSGGSSGDPITIAVNDVLIDDMGVSGQLELSPVIDLNEGSLNGWAYSLDTFKLEVMANQVKEAGFSGLVHIPIARSISNTSNDITPEDCLSYTAIIQPDNEYFFSVAPVGNDLYVDMWKADVLFENTSFVDVQYVNGEFKTEANLTGAIDIDGDFGNGKSAKIDDITFQNVVLSNQAPYFKKVGTWSFPEVGNKLAGFQFSISDVLVYSSGSEVDLNFDVLLGLTKNDNLGVTAEGGFKMTGEIEIINNRQRWKTKDFKINSLSIDASFPGVKSVQGHLNFFENNTVYGSGFRGGVFMEVEGINTSISAVAQFGKMPSPTDPEDNYRYFLIDAMANFEHGIDLGGLKITGFGGGVYYHMDRPSSSYTALPGMPTPIPTSSDDIVIPTALGASLSGVNYTPDPTKGLGVKATVALATTNEKVFNANTSFEILFNNNGGLSDIWFYGNFRVMEGMDITAAPTFVAGGGKPNNGAAMSGFIDIHYDFDTSALHANFEVYAKVAGGLLRGAGDNDKLGSGEFYFGPNDWYINIGKPDNRNGLAVSIPGISGNLASMESYFCVGTNIPPMPELPDNVKELTGAGNFMANESMRASGLGIVFGASFSVNTGDRTFLAFYGSFSAGAGYDLMLQNYGDAYCAHNNKPIGINGFYASGQAYAYIQGDIGVKAKVFGKTRSFEILSIGAAAVLQAKLPNPFWAKGTVGGRYSVCGGLVSGSCKFDVTIGQSCLIVGGSDPATDIDIIMSLAPNEGSADIPTVQNPSATFNVPLDTEISLGNSTKYIATLDYARVIHDGTVLAGQVVLSEDKLNLEFKPFDMLPSNSALIFQVKVTFEGDGQFIKEEERSVTFTTGDKLEYIPTDNVLASYPMNGQFNFYKEEYAAQKGYIILELGQPDLLYNNLEGTTTTSTSSFSPLSFSESGLSNNTNTVSFANVYPELKAVLSHDGQIVDDFPATYDKATKTVEFDFPASALDNRILYKLEIKYTQPSNSINPFANPSLYTLYFRTSDYNTLNAKLDDFNDFLNRELFVTNFGDYDRAYVWNTTVEYFDKFERNTPNNTNIQVLSTTSLQGVIRIMNSEGIGIDVEPFITEGHYNENQYPSEFNYPGYNGANKPPKPSDPQEKGPGDDYDVIFEYKLPGKNIITTHREERIN